MSMGLASEGAIAAGEGDVRQIIVGKELRSVRDAGQGDGESPVLLIGNKKKSRCPSVSLKGFDHTVVWPRVDW